MGKHILKDIVICLAAMLIIGKPMGMFVECSAEEDLLLYEEAPQHLENADKPATEYAALDEIPTTPYEVPAAEDGSKRWMDYRTIKDPSSTQWELQQLAWTDEDGFRRYGDAYMVAMGTYYAQTCGDAFRITLDTGVEFTALIADVKRDRDTDEKGQHRDGNVVEFIVDKDAIPRKAAVMGDMSYDTQFAGKIVSIDKL